MAKRKTRNRDKKSRFRFVGFLVIASMLAVFVGFQLGNAFFARQVGRDSDSEEIYETAPEEIEEEVPAPGEEDVVEESPPEVEEITPEPSEEERLETEEAPLADPAPDDLKEVEEQEDLDEFSYYVQVGSFSDRSNALNYAETIEADGFQVEVAETEPYRVLVIGGNSREEAEEVEAELRELGYETFIFSR